MMSEESTFEMVDPPPEQPKAPTPPTALPTPPAVPAGLPPPSALPAVARPANPFSAAAGPPPPPSAFAAPPPMPGAFPRPPAIPKPTAPQLPTPVAPTAIPPPVAPASVAVAPPTVAPVASKGYAMPVDPALLAASPLEAPSGEKEEDEEQLPDLIGWIASNPFFHKVVDKAKTSMDSMITTLDPQMKEFVYASGTVELAIASDQETIIGAVKDGFQRAFANVTARGMGNPGTTSLATTPNGFQNAIKAAKERVANLRASGLIPKGIPVIVIEEFLVKPDNTSEELHELECVLLDDPGHSLTFHLFSQSTPLSAKTTGLLKAHTPPDYAGAGSGFAISVGQAVAEETGCNPQEWKDTVLGIPRRQSLVSVIQALAALYKKRLPKSTEPES